MFVIIINCIFDLILKLIIMAGDEINTATTSVSYTTRQAVELLRRINTNTTSSSRVLIWRKSFYCSCETNDLF